MSVIIVGGGPVGLVAAHALHAAGIPFTLLESRALDDVLADGGASLFVGPHNLRVLHQLGLGDEIERLGVPLRDFYLRQGEGWKHYDHLGVLERK